MKKILTLLTLVSALFAQMAMADPVTITVSSASGTCLRGGSTAVTTGWFSTWTSTDAPTVTIQPASGTTNNMTAVTDGLCLAEGSATSFSYTVSVPSGFAIQSMTASLLSTDGTPTVSINGTSYTTSSTAQEVSLTDINKRSFNIDLSSSSSNGKATFTNWTITVDSAEVNTDPGIIYSTEAEPHWYYIVSNSTSSYCAGQAWYYDSSADRMKWGTKTFMADRIWSFWKNDEGKIAIKNYNGVYVGTAPSGQGSTTQFGKASAANYIYSIEFYSEDAFLVTDGDIPLHAQESGNVIVRWPASEGNASLWTFQEVDASNPEAVFGTTTVQQGRVTTGIGNKNLPIVRSTLTVGGLTGSVSLQGVSGKVTATDLSDVSAVRAYFATNSRELFLDPDSVMPWREQNGTLYGEATVNADGTFTVSGSKDLEPGTYYLWIVYDIAQTAKEGHTVDASISGYTVDGTLVTEKDGDPDYEATIFLSEGSALMPGDMGSTYYRIPAICTSADGKRLVILTDDRKQHNSDLPSHCYVVAQYSEDEGRTWSKPVTVAGTASTGGDYGHGDASLVTNRINGDIIGIMTSSANGTGFFASTPEKPQTWKTITSHDGGLTWGKPVDFTNTLYGAACSNPKTKTWKGGFSGSGAALQKRDGTLVSSFVNRDSANVQNFYFIMSKDGGKSWYVSGNSGTTSCDEPKTLERNNGDLAISVRQYGYNISNCSSDDGETWKKASQTRFTSGISGNGCDGDYMVWCSTLDGNAQNIAFQTCPNSSSRQNLSIAISTDEGETFSIVKTICPVGSAYSSCTVLPDGTLGVYYEENGVYGSYTMRFVRFSLEWATNGKYKFTDSKPFYPIQSRISYEMPDYEWNTIVLPYDAEVPSGLKAYNCTDQILKYKENDTDYTGILLEEAEGTTLQAFTPYVLNGTAGQYVFSRPASEWVAQTMVDSCIYKSGPLVGHFVSNRVTGNGTTIYNNFKNIASRGGVGFNRVTSGSAVNITAYSCHLALAEPSELTIHPLTEIPAGISAQGADTKDVKLYNLRGMERQPGERGIFVGEGKKVLIQ